ncbi:MAG: GNAT family N-acetyltransferase, partial [Ktedonobacteraceae bacterium]
ALDEQGHLVGFSQAVHAPWLPPGKFRVIINVDHAKHGQGIGSLLYNALQQFAEAHSASLLESDVREDHYLSIRFAKRRGFTIHRHLFEATLDLARFNETRFQGVIEQVEASGIRFYSLAELGEKLGDIVAAQKQLYEHTLRYVIDIPGSKEETLPPFEQMRKALYLSPGFPAEVQTIAVDGEKLVGSAQLLYYSANTSMYNGGSGVERAYRGRHIALALKLLAIRRAHRYGAVHLRTHNDSENAAMLALNRKLGYVPQPGLYTMQSTLTENTEEMRSSVEQ